MTLHFKLQILLILCCSPSFFQANSNTERSLSRKKRYVVFPEGSSFSIALCMTMHTLTPDDIFTEGLNWGISYDLPNESKPILEPFLALRKDEFKTNKKIHDKHGYLNNYAKFHVQPNKKQYLKSNYYYLQRRHRRDLYNKLEVVMNAMGYDGRTCVLRALCEASQTLMPKGNTLVEEMMRIAFSLPLKKVFSFEPEEHHTYTNAHKAGQKGQNCAAMFSGCTFSLIDMALGKYNTPEDSTYDQDTLERVTGTTDMGPPTNVRYNMK